MYTIHDKEYNYNSSINQNIKGEFVSREIYCNVSELMEYSFKQSWEYTDAPYKYDDIENLYDNSEETIKEYITYSNFSDQEIKEQLEEFDASSIDELDYDQLLELAEKLGFESESREIYEWWAVSNWLAEKLKEKGYPVIINNYRCSYWGRTTTGQVILLDSVISSICYDLEILEGQKLSWKSK